MIGRNLVAELRKSARWAPSITVTGPRQSGKTTLCRSAFPEHPYCSLEAPDARAFAAEDPRAFLEQYPEGAFFDEVQRIPDLLSYLQERIDADPAPGRWLLSGSQNFALRASLAQSLAGRTALHELLPLSWDEITRFETYPANLETALLTGGYPRILDRRIEPSAWLRSYVGAYIERDVRAISNIGDLSAFQRFLGLCAGRTGQLLNYSSLADDCGISQPSAKSWVSVLEASFIAFRLPTFAAGIRRRLVKMPKLYFYDTGLACWLLGIRSAEQIVSHPLRGALFETWVVSEVLKSRVHRGMAGNVSFYRDRAGAELDLVIDDAHCTTLIEAKSAATPSASLFDSARRVRALLEGIRPRMKIAVVYGGAESRRHSDGGVLIPWRDINAADFLRQEAE